MEVLGAGLVPPGVRAGAVPRNASGAFDERGETGFGSRAKDVGVDGRGGGEPFGGRRRFQE